MRDALPHASSVGFTGTPIEKADANTRAVFGDYISRYDIQRSVEEKLGLLPAALEHVLAQEDGKDRFRYACWSGESFGGTAIPPNKAEKANRTVLVQAALLAWDEVAA